MDSIAIVANNSTLIGFGRGSDYDDAVKAVCEHAIKEDQAPVVCDLDALVYLWELSYGYVAVPTETVATDDFMTLAAIRLNREGKLSFLSWEEPGVTVIAGPLVRHEKFEGYQLNADSR